MSETVHVFRDADRDWRWNVRSGNNKIIADSGEGYRNLAHAKRMAEQLFPGVPLEVEESDDEAGER